MFEKILSFNEKNVFENYIGFNNKNDFFEDLSNLKEFIDDNKYLFNKSFPLDIYISKYQILNVELLKNDKIFSDFLIDNFNFSIQEIDAYLKIKDLFLEDKNNNKNPTIILNFLIKILYWKEIYIDSNKNNNSNIFLFIGNIKKHEYYFLIFLYLLNWNIVYINGENFNPLIKFNINFQEMFLINGGIHEKIIEEDFLKYLNNKKNELIKNNFSSIKKILDYLIDFKDKSFYYILLGIDTNKEEYEENLLLIKDLFEKKFNNFILFENSITKPTVEEIEYLNSNYKYDDIENLINLLPNICNKKDIIIKFFNKYKNNFFNDSIFHVFQISMLIFLNRYNNILLDFSGIIFFGEIKKQDFYFLDLLNMLDVSILYINPNKQNIIKEDLSLFNVIEFDNSIQMDTYPKEKNIKKQETITYKAEQQIKDILHSGNEAILNPFQLNNKKMFSKLLISTLDEYLVLWKESTQFRTGFNNLDNKVEIPNMFIKINGVYKNIKKYWKMVNDMKNVEDCIFFEDINFLKQVSIDKYEFYGLAYLFDRNGYLKKEELINSDIYKNKLSYLNQDTQNIILEKIDLLFKENIFTKEIDINNKIEILLTILYLDDNILNTIQKHKFGEKNPKLLLYNNKKTIYPFRECAIMCFLCLLGFDIAILTPSNYNVIEQTISSDFFRSLMLEDICYDLKFNKKSFFNFFNML